MSGTAARGTLKGHGDSGGQCCAPLSMRNTTVDRWSGKGFPRSMNDRETLPRCANVPTTRLQPAHHPAASTYSDHSSPGMWLLLMRSASCRAFDASFSHRALTFVKPYLRAHPGAGMECQVFFTPLSPRCRMQDIAIMSPREDNKEEESPRSDADGA